MFSLLKLKLIPFFGELACNESTKAACNEAYNHTGENIAGIMYAQIHARVAEDENIKE